MSRKALSKRVRFEVLKRDGFRCRYCGANASSTVLHVDHVIAVADGGTDDPSNLVAARGLAKTHSGRERYFTAIMRNMRDRGPNGLVQ